MYHPLRIVDVGCEDLNAAHKFCIACLDALSAIRGYAVFLDDDLDDEDREGLIAGVRDWIDRAFTTLDQADRALCRVELELISTHHVDAPAIRIGGVTATTWHRAATHLLNYLKEDAVGIGRVATTSEQEDSHHLMEGARHRIALTMVQGEEDAKEIVSDLSTALLSMNLELVVAGMQREVAAAMKARRVHGSLGSAAGPMLGMQPTLAEIDALDECLAAAYESIKDIEAKGWVEAGDATYEEYLKGWYKMIGVPAGLTKGEVEQWFLDHQQKLPPDESEILLRVRELQPEYEEVVFAFETLGTELDALNAEVRRLGFGKLVVEVRWQNDSEKPGWVRQEINAAQPPPFQHRIGTECLNRLDPRRAALDEKLFDKVKNWVLNDIEEWQRVIGLRIDRHVIESGWTSASPLERAAERLAERAKGLIAGGSPKDNGNGDNGDSLPAGDWLQPPVSLKTMARRLGGTHSPEKLKMLLNQFGLRNYPSSNRQSWTVNLAPPMPPELKGKLETPAKEECRD